MRTLPSDLTILILLPLALFFVRVIGDGDTRTSSTKFSNLFMNNQKPQLVSFNTKEGDIEINWDVSVPFFRIPLSHMTKQNEISPLIDVNTRGFSIAGIITAILTLAVPVLSKPGPGMHYRSSDSQWSRMGNTINEIMLSNNYVTPCIQRIICSIISEASHSNNPTSTDKIIDGLSSHEWFKEFTNGTVLQEAVRIGREKHHDCGRAYKECFVTPRIFKSIMMQFGAI